MTNDYENLFAFVIIYGIPYYSYICGNRGSGGELIQRKLLKATIPWPDVKFQSLYLY